MDLGATLQVDADEEPRTATALSRLVDSLHRGGFVEIRTAGGELVGTA